MTLAAILVATLVAGIGSVWLAAFLMRCGFGSRGGVGSQHLLSLAAGALLSTAFMHLLPEAFESGQSPQLLFALLLGGLVFFFLLDKAELWHHGHEHHQGAHGHGHGHDHDHSHDHAHGHAHGAAGHAHPHADGPRRGGGWAVLAGDSVHCFGDGILIASAFMADLHLGWIAALAVLAHEVPHHIGDLAVVRRDSQTAASALRKVSLAATVTALGGLAGYFLLERLEGWVPYFLVVASSSFVYVALADLIPQLQRRLTVGQTAAQIGWLLAGIVLVVAVSSMAHHGHDHDHGHDAHGHAHDGHDHAHGDAAAPAR